MISVLVAAFAVGGPAVAAGSEPPVTPKEARIYCASASDLARVIMTGHQRGASVKDAMKAADKDDSDLSRRLIIEAYKAPMYETKEYQDRAVTKFANAKYIECYELLTKGK